MEIFWSIYISLEQNITHLHFSRGNHVALIALQIHLSYETRAGGRI